MTSHSAVAARTFAVNSRFVGGARIAVGAATHDVRVRITRAPTSQWVDAIRLDTFHVGQIYDVGYTVATYLLAQGWAEMVDALPHRLTEGDPAVDTPRPFVRREGEPPLSDGVSILPDRRSGERRQVTDRRRTATTDRRRADRRQRS